LSHDLKLSILGGNLGDFLSLKKVSQGVPSRPVPITNTGGLDEKSKASGRKRFKELGKKTGRNLGRCPALCVAQGRGLAPIVTPIYADFFQRVSALFISDFQRPRAAREVTTKDCLATV